MSETNKESYLYLPKWASNIFDAFVDKHERLSHVLLMSITGIRFIQKRHGLLHELLEINGTLGKHDSKEKLRLAKKEMELAQREVEYDFPLLHEQATIALWSSLEALIRSLVAGCLANETSTWQLDSISRLQVRLGEYESLDHLEKCLWITDLLDQSTSAPNKSGINRFEKLLQPFNLHGSFDDKYSKSLYELHQIRNALVHRNGIVDRKLVSSCSWLDFKLGQQILISHEMWDKYQESLGKYVIAIAKRTKEQFGRESKG